MPAPHVFVDESKAHGLLVAAAVLNPADLALTRTTLRALVHPGSHRIHMTRESNTHRRKVAAAIAALPVTVDIYDATSYPNRQELQARQHCLEHLVANLAGTGCARLVLELDESLAVHDRRVLYAAGHAHGLDPTWRYEHLRARDEPLLWIADVVAWCWPKGGNWKQMINPIVGTIHQL